MLEGVLLHILEVYFGDYVESINREQLKLGVFKGKVVLQDLKLKRQALKRLKLPIEVREGYIEQLELNVPWKKLASESTTLRITGVRIIGGPETELERHATKEHDPKSHRDALRKKREQELERKFARLEAAELLSRQLDAGDVGAELGNLDTSFSSSTSLSPSVASRKKGGSSLKKKILQKIFNNIKITFSDVLIQYRSDDGEEDMAIEIGGISMETVNVESKPAFFEYDIPFLFRNVSVVDFSIKCMENILLQPLNAKATILQALDDDAARLVEAKLSVKATIDPVLWKADSNELLHVIRSLRTILSRRQTIIRTGVIGNPAAPLDPPTSNPRAWWKYAIQRVIGSLRPRYQFDLLQTITNRTQYIDLYKRKLDMLEAGQTFSDSGSGSTPSSKKLLQVSLSKMETELPIDTILLYRKLATRENSTVLFEAETIDDEEQEDILEALEMEDKKKTKKKVSKLNPTKWLKRGFKLRLGQSKKKRNDGALAMPSIEQQKFYEMVLNEQEMDPAILALGSNWFNGAPRRAEFQFMVELDGLTFQTVFLPSNVNMNLSLNGLAVELVSHLSQRESNPWWETSATLSRLTLAHDDKLLVDVDMCKVMKDDRTDGQVFLFSPNCDRAFARVQAYIDKPQVFGTPERRNSFGKSSSFKRKTRRRSSKLGLQLSEEEWSEIIAVEGAQTHDKVSILDLLMKSGRQRIQGNWGTIRMDLDVHSWKALVEFFEQKQQHQHKQPPVSTTKAQQTKSKVKKKATSMEVDFSLNELELVLPHYFRPHDLVEITGKHFIIKTDPTITETVASASISMRSKIGPKPTSVNPIMHDYHPIIRMLESSTEDGKVHVKGALPPLKLMLDKTSLEVFVGCVEAFRVRKQGKIARRNRGNSTHRKQLEMVMEQIEIHVLDHWKLELKNVIGSNLDDEKLNISEFKLTDCKVETCFQEIVLVRNGVAKVNHQYQMESLLIGWNHTLPQRLGEFVDGLDLYQRKKKEQSAVSENQASSSTMKPNVRVDTLTIEMREEALHRGFLRAEFHLDYRPEMIKLRHISLQSCLSRDNVGIELIEHSELAEIDIDVGDEVVLTTARNFAYTHYQNLFKELVDYVEYGLNKPISQLKGIFAVSKGTPTPQGEAGKVRKPRVGRVHMENWVVRLPAARSAEQQKAVLRGRFEFRYKACKISQVVPREQRFHVEFEHISVATDIENRGKEFIIENYDVVRCTWIRSPFSAEEAIVRKSLYVQGIDGIRSWYNAPSGFGYRNSFEWDLSGSNDSAQCMIAQDQYNLFNIVLSENMTDWRGKPHSCKPRGWAASDMMDSTPATHPCFCETLASQEQILELQFSYKFPRNLSMRLDGSSFLLSVRNFRYAVKEHLRYGRRGEYFADEVVLQVPHKGKLFKTTSSPRMVLTKTKSRDQTFEIHISDANMTLDVGSVQHFIFFFNGNSALRTYLGCPNTFGTSPILHRRAKATRRKLGDATVRLKLTMGYSRGAEERDIVMGVSIRKAEAIKSRLQHGSLAVEGTIEDAIGASEFNVLESPIDFSYDNSKVPSETIHNKRLVISVSPIRILVTQLGLRDNWKNLNRWHKRVHKVGQSILKQRKRDFYEKYSVTPSKTQSIFQIGGYRAIVVDAKSSRLFPLGCFAMSSFIMRQTTELLERGRRITTFEGDFVEIPSTLRLDVERTSQNDDDIWCGAHEKCGVIVAYFNTRIAKWEPVLEPLVWEWTIQRTSSMVLKEPSALATQIKVHRRLNVNFSYAFFKTLQWTLAILKVFPVTSSMETSQEPRVIASSSLSSANIPYNLSSKVFTIRNETGWKLQFWNDHDGDGGVKTELETDASTSFQNATDSKVLNISWASWHAIEGIPLHQVGSFVYTLYPKVGESYEKQQEEDDMMMMTKVCVDVAPFEGGMHITVRSLFEIRNMTIIPIEVLLIPGLDPISQRQCMGHPGTYGPILPKSGLLLPIHSLHCSFSIRPLEMDWWEGMDLKTIEQNLGKETHFKVACSDSVTLNLQVLSHQASNIERVKRFYTLIISPTISVENLLPVSLWMKLDCSPQQETHEQVAEQDKNEHEVLPGQSIGLLEAPETMSLRFRVSSSSWSQGFQVSKSTEQQPNIEVTDRRGRTVTLMIDLEHDPSSFSWQIRIYTTVWLFNRTGLDLSYKSGDKQLMENSSISGSKVIHDEGRQLEKKEALKFRHGQPVQAWSRRLKSWTIGSIFQVNAYRGTYDILFDDGWLSLDVSPSEVRHFNHESKQQQHQHHDDDEEDEERTRTEDDDSDSTDDDEKEKQKGDDEVIDDGINENEAQMVLGWENEMDIGLDSIVMFSEGSHICAKIKHSEWSVPFHVESIGTKRTLSLPVRTERSLETRTYCEIGVQVGLAPLKFRRTKVITFMPRFVIITDMKKTAVGDSIVIAQSSSVEAGKAIETTLIRMKPSEVRPFYFMKNLGSDHTEGVICIRFESKKNGEQWEWSGGFSIMHDIQTTIKIRSMSSGEVRVLRLRVATHEATSYVTLSLEEKGNASKPPLYRIENRSSHLVHYAQDFSQPKLAHGGFQSEGKSALESSTNFAALSETIPSHGLWELDSTETRSLRRGIMERLFPTESNVYGWDRLCYAKRVLIFSFQGDSKLYGCEIDELNQKSEIQVSDQAKIWVTTYFDGTTKVICLSDVDPDSARTGPRTSSVDQHDREDETSSIALQLAINDIGLSVIDSMPQEVMYMSFGSISFDFLQHPTGDRSVELMVGWMQIDNQLVKARIPTVLAPVKYTASFLQEEDGDNDGARQGSSSSASTTEGFLQLSLIERNALRDMDCMILEYVGLAIHEFSLTIEMEWVLHLWRLFDECSALPNLCYEHALFLNNNGSEVRKASDHEDMRILEHWLQEQTTERRRFFKRNAPLHTKKRKIYFEWLELFPIKMNLNVQNLVDDPNRVLDFSLYGRSSANNNSIHGDGEENGIYSNNFDDRTFDPNSVLAALPHSFSDIEGATMLLNALVLRNVILTPSLLRQRLVRHISSQALSQIYRIVGSSEALGNPIGLVTNLGSGLRDLFYEPAQGLILGPEAFGAGLARGSRLFVYRTAFGTFDSISKLSSSIGSGVALLSLDQKYLSRRRASIIDERPRHIGDGLVLGAKSLGLGISHGISGIVMEPIRGAEEEGVGGFFKGVGIGLVGVAVKPAVGVFDMVARFLAGIRGTAAMLDPTEKPVRRRLPRVLHTNQHHLLVYDASAAFVQSLLLETWGLERVRRTNNYISHTPLPNHLLLVYSGFSLGCIDYSCFAPNTKSVLLHPELIWNIDTRMVVNFKKYIDQSALSESHKLQLRIQVSDMSCLTYAELRTEFKIQCNAAACELVLFGNDATITTIYAALQKVTSFHSSARKKGFHRTDFGASLCPVPRTAFYLPSIETIFDTVHGKTGMGLICNIKQDSVAEKVGLRQGDILVAVGGCALDIEDCGDALLDAYEELPSGSILEVTIFRKGKWLNQKILLSSSTRTSALDMKDDNN